MSRRSAPYLVRLPGCLAPVRLSRLEYFDYLSRKFIIATKPRRARVAAAYHAWLDDGKLRFQARVTSSGPSIATNAEVIDRLWPLAHGGRSIFPRAMVRAIRLQFGAEAERILDKLRQEEREWAMREQYGY